MKQRKATHYYTNRELVKVEKVTTRFTEKDYNQLMRYCKDNYIKPCDLIRSLISEVIYNNMEGVNNGN